MIFFIKNATQSFMKNAVNVFCMPFSFRSKLNQPFRAAVVLQFCIIVIVILSFVAGYYHALLKAEQRKYLRLEDRYVRVRNQLGREVMQQLIDDSYISPSQP